MSADGVDEAVGEPVGPERIPGTIEVGTRVLAERRPPEPAVSRTHGAISAEHISRHGLEIACTTSFAARRAAYAEVGRAEREPPMQGLLGGPLPARGDDAHEARANVRVVSANEHE